MSKNWVRSRRELGRGESKGVCLSKPSVGEEEEGGDEIGLELPNFLKFSVGSVIGSGQP